jgi:hypothetical protein
LADDRALAAGFVAVVQPASDWTAKSAKFQGPRETSSIGRDGEGGIRTHEAV